MEKQYTLTIISENQPGVLYRVAAIFIRKKVNIERLTVFETETKGLSQFTIVFNTKQWDANRILSLIKKIIEVREASIV